MQNVRVDRDKKVGFINRNIYGHFSEHLGRCIYGGIFVGNDSELPNVNGMRIDVIEALKAIKIPVLRWPGGCFADEYHWEDGIGPLEDRPTMINTHWGGVTEDNSFGTHDFFELCDQLGCEPYICGNVGSGTVREMSRWVEYMTFGGVSPMSKLRGKNGHKAPWTLKYFGVGNENWGCGGGMRPEYYADLYRRYQTYCRNYDDNKLYKIACGPNSDDYNWMEVMMDRARCCMDAIALHYYTFSRGKTAVDFDDQGWFDVLYDTLKMEDLLNKHIAIMDKYDPEKKVELLVDEWGTWYDVEEGTNPGFLYQQNTLRDALVAALNFHIFHSHTDRVTMTNIAQVVNVLQSPILTQDDKMLLTPTYHIFEMFTPHHDADVLSVQYDKGEYTMGDKTMQRISVSASKKDGKVCVSVVNLNHNQSETIELSIDGKFVSGRILTSDKLNAHNTFNELDNVVPTDFDDVTVSAETHSITLPPASVVVLNFE